MAKKPQSVSAPAVSDVNLNVLQMIAAVSQNGTAYVSEAEGLPLLKYSPPLIDVDTANVNAEGKAAARLTPAGMAMVNGAARSAPTPAASTSPYAIITNAVLPTAKRGGGGGAPMQYPFDKLEVGGSFFVPVSAKHPNPAKSLGSTISSANMKYAEDTGETKQVDRAKRDPNNKRQFLKDAAGDSIMETVTRPVYKFTRKFSIRPVEAGKHYGEWVAPDNGALIARIK